MEMKYIMFCNTLNEAKNYKDIQGYRQVIEYKYKNLIMYQFLETNKDGQVIKHKAHNKTIKYQNRTHPKPGSIYLLNNEIIEIEELLDKPQYLEIQYDKQPNQEYTINDADIQEEITAKIIENEVLFKQKDEYTITGYTQVADGIKQEKQYYINRKLEKGDIIITAKMTDINKEIVLNYEPSMEPQQVTVKLVAIDKTIKDQGKIITKWLVL